MQKEAAKKKIGELVEKYENVVKSGKLKQYTEEETKKDFILPLFEVLGWDVYNKNEVSAEEHIVSSGRVDYGFYLNSRPKFFVEAKPLKADLHKEEYADQAIRYSWNKGVTWAVLTDFESIKIFNAQDTQKDLSDKLFFEIPQQEYLERFDQLWLLSKEAFEKGLTDKEAERYGKKLQKISVTESLYKDLNLCRDILTKGLRLWNKDVSDELLDEGVQKLINRLIFLRVAEDRGVEPPTLIPLIRAWKSGKKKEDLYESMISKFRELDKIYNSNLFSEHPMEKWEEHGGATEEAIHILYGKKGYYEYDFSIMPADVLGSVYENYLSYKQSKTNSTDNKRKKQGIYYTPAYVVDYIVENALKPVLDQCHSITDLQKVRVLDPACGSGSFLIKALDAIYKKYKTLGNRGGVFTKLGILTTNIYGVDLDQNAVEIARLNLLIRALDERIKLPLLSHNIRVGNSLISGTDEELEKSFGKNFKDKKPFNWKEEFPEVFKQGGFDVIIGNPPYIFARGGNFDEKEKQFYYEHFKLQKYQINTYTLFIEQSYQLLKNSGSFGFIVPNNWLTINTLSNIREFLLKNVSDLTIINIIDKVFNQASVDTGILLFKKGNPTKITVGAMSESEPPQFNTFSPENFYKNKFIINLHQEKNIDTTINLKNTISLGKIARVSTGLKTYQIGKGNPVQNEDVKKNRKFHSNKKEDDTYRPYLQGVDVKRYTLNWSGEYLSYGPWLAEPRKSVPFKGERILVRQIPSPFPRCINAVFTQSDFINDINSMVIFSPTENFQLKYILGILNSRLISYWFVCTLNKFQRKIFPQFKVNELAQFPIYQANKQRQYVIVSLVDKIMDLNKKLKEETENSNKWNELKSEIEKTDKKIDEEVYKLYDLTPEEISIIEQSK